MNDAQDPQTITLASALCDCGSGLRRVRCCALDFSTQPDQAQYGLLATEMEAVTAAKMAGKNRVAARLLLRLLDLAPLWPEALLGLFEIRLAEGNKLAATALAARIAAIQPENAIALARHAGILAARELYQEAVEVVRRGMLVAPRLPLFHQILGMSYTELGQLRAGEHHYRQALALSPAGQSQIQLRTWLAWSLRLQGRLDEAAALYATLCAEAGAGNRALTGFAQVEAGRGRWSEAQSLLAAALKLTPDDRLTSLLAAQFELQRGTPEAALQRIAATEARLAPQKLVVTEYMIRGEALERQGDYESAWASYQAGRAVQSQHVRRAYDPAPGAARLEAIKATFKPALLSALPRPASLPGLPCPVFLLGVTGSGTALLEHLLSQSPHIDPADQRASLPALASLLSGLARGMGGPELPFPQALRAAICGPGREIPAMLAARYTQQLVNDGLARQDTKFVTDRHVELPWLLGLATSLFPQAPVVHMLRHPVDVILSGFTSDRLYDNQAGLMLTSLAQAYDQQMQAIAHLRGQMTMRYLPVKYEALVTNPAATLRRIYEFIGLPDEDPAALLAAPVRAVPQVPVYRAWMSAPHRDRLYRHRRFAGVFADSLPWLMPWIKRLGYEMLPLPIGDA